jgi:hypothetical protein
VKREVALVVVAGTGLLSVRAEAADTQISGVVDVHAGYGSNPLFDLNSLGASPTIGAVVRATVTRSTALSRTEATGEADIDQYLKHYGSVRNYQARLRHNQQLSQRFALSGDVAYIDTINQNPSYGVKSADLGPLTDLLTVGQRTRRISGGLDLSWEANEKNLFQAGLNGSHATFSGGNSYDQYGASFGYLRTVNAHTKIGFQGGASLINQTGQPRAKSYTGGLQLVQDVNARWHLEAGVSLLAQTNLGRLVKSVGFNLSICGKYPRVTVCFLGSRFGAPSGLGGGQRTDTQGGVRVNYAIDEHSSLEASATYDVSASTGTSGSGINIPTQKYWDGALNYRREITKRLSGGASLRAQRRDYGALFTTTGNKVNAYTATFNLSWKFGRI